MTTIGANTCERRGRRPYWLLLVIALLLAGQNLAAGHWHDDALGIDADCALCLLSSAGTDALPASGWAAPAFALCAWLAATFNAPLRRIALRFHDSRAPPFRS